MTEIYHSAEILSAMRAGGSDARWIAAGIPIEIRTLIHEEPLR